MAMNSSSDVDSLTHFMDNTAEVIEQLKLTGQPMVLTVHGKAEVVVQDELAADVDGAGVVVVALQVVDAIA